MAIDSKATLQLDASGSEPMAQGIARDWALLVYMVSDGPKSDQSAPGTDVVNLDDILSTELRSLGKAAIKAPKVHVAVQADLLRASGTLRWNTASDESVVTAEVTSTDPGVLADFLRWGITQCPARNYALLFWGHSAGPSGLFTDELPVFGLAKPRVDTLHLRNLAQAMDEGNKVLRTERQIDRFQLVVFKDCFQSLLETCFELGATRPDTSDQRANYMIASQGLIPVAVKADGATKPKAIAAWPYRKILQALSAGPSAREAATEVLKGIGAFYGDRKHRSEHIEVPMALLELTAVSNLVEPLQRLGKSMSAVLQDPLYSTRVERALRIAFRGIVDGDPVLVDVQSLCDRLSELSIDSKEGGDLEKAVLEVKAAIKTVVRGNRPVRSNFHGLSAYHFPAWAGDRQGSAIGQVDAIDYRRLQLNQRTGWSDIALMDTPSMAARRRFA